MSILFVLVPLALLLAASAVAAFVWSVQHGQMDDLTTPALRMLEQDPSKADATASKSAHLQRGDNAQLCRPEKLP
jgi:cbb3-type cytochrome oxidase maturation protein